PDTATQLQDFLRDKEMLLVLDNFEHLLDGVGQVTRILQYSTDIKILATSRERLYLQEEWLFPIEGLSVPEDTVEHIQDYSAVQLFMETARRVQPSFSATAEQATVVNICRLAEGMPLAIELAAGWLRMMPAQEIVQHIDADLNFLNTTWRNVPERH